MPLFTVVLDFAGGTYISQVEAKSADAAPTAWATKLEPGEVRGMGEASIQVLRAAMAKESPVRLEGLVQAWCVSAVVRGRLALVHMVQTCGQPVMANQSLEPTRVGKPPLAAQLQR